MTEVDSSGFRARWFFLFLLIVVSAGIPQWVRADWDGGCVEGAVDCPEPASSNAAAECAADGGSFSSIWVPGGCEGTTCFGGGAYWYCTIPVYSQGYYQGYYEGYYQGYYEGYYQSYYEGYYQSYYEGAYGPMQPDLTATYTGPTSGAIGSITLSGRAINNGTAMASNFTSYFEVQASSTLAWTSPAISLAGGGAFANLSKNHSFGAGVYQVRLCADGGGTVGESNEGNNCSWPWTTLTVSAAPTASLSASPNPIPAGSNTTIYWNSTDATSCTQLAGTGFNTSGNPNGNDLVNPAVDGEVYRARCDGPGGSVIGSVTINFTGGGSCNDSGPVVITTSPSRVVSGNTATLSWTVSNASAACTVTGPGVSQTTSAPSGCSISGSVTTPPITTQSTYTLSCPGGQGDSIIVNVAPQYEEF